MEKSNIFGQLKVSLSLSLLFSIAFFNDFVRTLEKLIGFKFPAAKKMADEVCYRGILETFREALCSC